MIEEIVTTQYKEKITMAREDVVLRIEEQSCLSCREYDAIFKEIASEYGRHIHFYTINGLSNDVPGIRPDSFPTVVFYPYDRVAYEWS